MSAALPKPTAPFAWELTCSPTSIIAPRLDLDHSVGCFVSALPLVAQDDDSEIPDPLTVYKGRRIAQTMHFDGAGWLVRESRQREEDCATMLKQLGVQPGMTVCDMGCGNGFYTVQLAELVGPTGTVLAVDIQPEMLRKMEVARGRAGACATSSQSMALSSTRSCPTDKST